MDALRVPVYYDFSSSICYVAHRVMQRMAPDLVALELALEWRPMDLTRRRVWRFGAKIEGRRRENVLRVARDLEVGLRVPPRWMDTRAAMAVSLALAGTPRESAWRERVWTAIYDEGRSLEEPGALERLAADLGIEVSGFDVEGLMNRLEADTLACMEQEVTGVPTFMLDGWPIGGIQTVDTMRSLLGRYAAKKRSSDVS